MKNTAYEVARLVASDPGGLDRLDGLKMWWLQHRAATRENCDSQPCC